MERIEREGLRYDDKAMRFVMDGVDPMPEHPIKEAVLWREMVSVELIRLKVEEKIADAVYAGRQRGLTDAEIVHKFVWEQDREMWPLWKRLLKSHLLVKVLGQK